MGPVMKMNYHAKIIRIAVAVLLSSISLCVIAETEIEHENAVNLFVGRSQNGSLNGPSIGLGYERRLTSLVGVGGYLELAGGDFHTTAVDATLHLHPHAGWEFTFSPSFRVRKQ